MGTLAAMSARPTVAMTLRLPRDLHERLSALAAFQGSSINYQAVRAIRERVEASTDRGK